MTTGREAGDTLPADQDTQQAAVMERSKKPKDRAQPRTKAEGDKPG
jgi:hypothetical protein